MPMEKAHSDCIDLYSYKNGVSSPTLAIAEKYLSAKEDLIHKATGWMLREVGKPTPMP